MMNDENITIENDLINEKENENKKYIIEIEEECIFCQETSSDLIDYDHSCGKYKIHQETHTVADSLERYLETSTNRILLEAGSL